MQRAIIFLNGDLSDLSQAQKYIQPDDYIICADGGAKHALNLNLKPNAIIGDLDSLSQDLQTELQKEEIEWHKFKTEKDETDSELALNFAIKKGFKTIFLFGVFGSRLDHFLSNIFALTHLTDQGITVTIIEGKKEIKIFKQQLSIQGTIGDIVSLIPIATDAKNITTTGLKYKLNNENLFFGYSRGISNELTAKEATVKVEKGTLLMIHEKQ
ncbi:MAG TPA: thiamine diphosphokinase [Patescibacteria group bacterium]